MTDTPELDRQAEIINSGKAEIVQEFLDWLLDEKKIEPAVWIEPRCERLEPVFLDRHKTMAEFFGIDLDKIEAERRRLLSQIGNANLGRAGG